MYLLTKKEQNLNLMIKLLIKVYSWSAIIQQKLTGGILTPPPLSQDRVKRVRELLSKSASCVQYRSRKSGAGVKFRRLSHSLAACVEDHAGYQTENVEESLKVWDKLWMWILRVVMSYTVLLSDFQCITMILSWKTYLFKNKYAIHAYTHGPVTGSALSHTSVV